MPEVEIPHVCFHHRPRAKRSQQTGEVLTPDVLSEQAHAMRAGEIAFGEAVETSALASLVRRVQVVLQDLSRKIQKAEHWLFLGLGRWVCGRRHVVLTDCSELKCVGRLNDRS